jgi:hypothetical protein
MKSHTFSTPKSVTNPDSHRKSSSSIGSEDITLTDSLSVPNPSLDPENPTLNPHSKKEAIKMDLLDAMDDDDFLVQTKPGKTKPKPGFKNLDDSVDLDSDFDDFVDLESEPGVGFLRNKSRPNVRNFHPIVFKENHFRIPHEKKDKLNPPIDFPRPDQRILIKELNLRSVLNVFISEISVNYFSQVFCRFFFSRRKYFDASKHEMSHNNLDKKIATHKN